MKCAYVVAAVALAGCGAEKNGTNTDIAEVAKARDSLQAALRATDGKRACGLMTERLHRQIAATVLREAPLIAGTDCVTLVGAYGKEIAEGGEGRTRERSTGGCVDWLSHGTNTYNRAVKNDGWKFDGAGRCQ